MKKGAAAVGLIAAGAALFLLARPAAQPPAAPPAPPAPRTPRQKPPQVMDDSEAQVKAALLYPFLCHSGWPVPDPGKESTPLLLGVLGVSSVGDALHLATLDKEIGGRRIRIVRGNSLPDLPPCQLLFIPSGWKDDWDLILPAVGKPGVLLVGEEGGFLEAGGGIALRIEDRRVRYSMHLGNIRAARVDPGSKLVDLANPLRR